MSTTTDIAAGQSETPRVHIAPVVLAAALVFWGWQTNNPFAGAGFAVAILLPVITQLRLELSEHDQHRIADLTMVLYVAVAASFIATDGLRLGVHDSLVWLPGVALPLMLAQTMCVEGRVPMTALFRYLRKKKARGEKVHDPKFDLTGPYLALILISAGMANREGVGFFVGVTVIVAAALFRIRPSRVGLTRWFAALGLATAAGFGVHTGLYTLQTIVEDWIIDWQFSVAMADPYRSSTRIGELGRLKFEDAIVMRVYAAEDGRDKPDLLHQASYNYYAGSTWLARQGGLEQLRASGDGTLFALGPSAPGPASTSAPTPAPTPATKRLRLTQRVQGGRTLLALPLAVTGVTELVASRVRTNPFGAVQAEMEVPWTFYTALYSPDAGAGDGAYAAVNGEDLYVPEKERPALETLARELDLASLAPQAALQRVHSHLAQFKYTTVRDHPFSNLIPGAETPLAEFLNTTKKGHCEYFATAATLLLRSAGIPARYATGYAIGDWSSWEQAWIVRERHSHAWTRAFVAGRWVDFDTTPAVWFAEEETLAPVTQKLVDFLRWAGFRWSTRDDGDARYLAWGVVGLAVVILVWKLVTEGGLVRLAGRGGGAISVRPGDDSEFFAIEAALAEKVPRARGEPLFDWLPRATSGLDPGARSELTDLAGLHYRYRFDPRGLDTKARAALTAGCGKLLRDLRGASVARRA